MQPGIYLLLLMGVDTSVRVGSLGTVSFATGYYGYVGSALGPGGLARVSRHMWVASGKGTRPRWHIDYLLTNLGFRLLRVYCAITVERLECPLAHAIPLQVVPGFGSSDCNCEGHLFFSPEDPDQEITNSFEAVGLYPEIRPAHLPGTER
ncbi:MAG: GIY-YIG nuclease family protein [Methanospirillum sp.]|uniref:GIY-YIG nuclease family protein n=1 Tax=Methanospirillum sp. TaxID=45200 RepID=UPI00236D98F4|nr:GIY-YIG nuclease family protein [Methanospirillum sp.]MDD1728722.1 GIY-YIG nuclease family protein [Methanospirillum sp.]